jgi:hypothetical protein
VGANKPDARRKPEATDPFGMQLAYWQTTGGRDERGDGSLGSWSFPGWLQPGGVAPPVAEGGLFAPLILAPSRVQARSEAPIGSTAPSERQSAAPGIAQRSARSQDIGKSIRDYR